MAQLEFRTFNQQLDILSKDRNISYANIDQANALNVIKSVGYSSILKYLKCFNIRLTFNDIYKIYLFDSILKSESLRLIGLVERYVKTVISNTFISNHEFNSLCYQDKDNFLYPYRYQELYQSRIKPFNSPYTPFWTVLESTSLGDLIQMYDLMFENDRIRISKIFNKNHDQFSKELSLIKRIRNICAHFNELLNRVNFFNEKCQENRITRFFDIIVSWIPDIDEWNKFTKRLSNSLNEINNDEVKEKITKLFNFSIKINQ